MTKIVIDPITRIEGHLRIEAAVDGGKITDAWSSSTMFRGIETTADKIGLGIATATAVAFAAHGVISAFRKGDESEGAKED